MVGAGGQMQEMEAEEIMNSPTNPPPSPGYQDLGYINDWSDTPAIVLDCCAKGHQIEEKNVGPCHDVIWCAICRYVYHVDSSD